MKKIKAVKMATGGLMSMPPYIAKQDKTSDGITPYDVNTPMSARKGLPSRALDLSLILISEPTRLRRISYAVICLKKKKKRKGLTKNVKRALHHQTKQKL